jgi:uncharacterized protein
MSFPDRRDVLQATIALAVPAALLPHLTTRQEAQESFNAGQPSGQDTGEAGAIDKSMPVHYLEIVTPEVEAVCAQYSKVFGVTFGEPDPNLGGARTTKLAGGGTLGIRGPLRDDEAPVVRPYMLVEDIAAAVAAAAEAGAEVALPSMELPGHGTCAIVVQGGIDFGFWQL